MSAIEFASFPKFPYKKLKHEGGFDDDQEIDGVILRSRSWRSRFRSRVCIRKRFKVKIPHLRRFLRRKVRVASAVRILYIKVLKRLKESQDHFGDLFAGNYIFTQVSPTPLKSLEQSCKGQDIKSLASGSSLPRIA